MQQQQQGDSRQSLPGESAVSGGGSRVSAPVHNYQYLSGSAPESTLRHSLLDEVQETPSASSVSLYFSQTVAASESENYNVSSSSCSSLPDPPEDMLNHSLSPRWGSSGGSNPDRPRHPIVPSIDLDQIEQLDAYLHSSLQARSPEGHGDFSKLERRHSSSDLPHSPPSTPLTSSRSLGRLHGDREGEGEGDGYPDEIYVDIPSLDSAARSSSASQLKVLSLDDGSQPVPANIQQERAVMAELCSSSRGRQVLQSCQRIRDTAEGEITGEIFTVTLHKDGPHLGLGLIDGLYTPLQSQGIYIRNIMPGTPASQTSRLEIGDRILAVNGRSIVGADYHSAMKLIWTAGSGLNLLVAKCDKHVALKIIATRF